MRSTIRRLALVPGTLLATGALVLGMATAAGAVVTSSNWGGERAGNGNYHFRYVQALFTVPQHACVSDDYAGSVVHLGGTIDYVTLGVACISPGGGAPPVPTAFYTYNNGQTTGTSYGTATVTADDTVFASIYYNSSNNIANVYEYDETSATTLENTFQFAGTAQYKWATVAGEIIPSQPAPPGPGSSITLVPFSQVRVTTYSGQKGSGLAGPWSVQAEETFNGAHEIFGPTGANKSVSSFNATEYNNA
jgi:hypothetical protein